MYNNGRVIRCLRSMEGDDIILNFPKLNPSTIGTMMMADTNNAAMTIIVEAFLDVMVFCGSSEFFPVNSREGLCCFNC